MDLSTAFTVTLSAPLLIGGVVRQKPSIWPAWHEFQKSRGASHTSSPLVRRLVGSIDFILAATILYRPTRLIGATIVGTILVLGTAKQMYQTGGGLMNAKEEFTMACLAGGILWAETR